MRKTAATNKTTSTEEATQVYMKTLAARGQFLAATLGMGWQLALTVLIPLVAGIQIDKHFKSSPSYTLAGFMLAVAGGAAVVWKSVKEVNAEQTELDAEEAEMKAEIMKSSKKGIKQ
jgi:F0F1-type ATP synthase assembly protein I